MSEAGGPWLDDRRFHDDTDPDIPRIDIAPWAPPPGPTPADAPWSPAPADAPWSMMLPGAARSMEPADEPRHVAPRGEPHDLLPPFESGPDEAGGPARRALDWYRSAPLAHRVKVDVAATIVLLVLIVGLAVGLGRRGESPMASATDGTVTTATPATTSTAPTTTAPSTTTTSTTTTITTTPTTVPPTTAPPVVPPPTDPPAPPTTTTTAPPTTTTEAVSYRNCREARRAGVAPISEGQPGYEPRLDTNNDGLACWYGDDW